MGELRLQGELALSTPTPLARFTGAREGFCVFKLQWKSHMAPLAPGRRAGLGVRGEGPLGFHAGRRAMPPHTPRGQARAATVRKRRRRRQPAWHWCPACGP